MIFNRPLKKLRILTYSRRCTTNYQHIRHLSGTKGSDESSHAYSGVFRALVGNSLISCLKLGAWVHTGSSVMFAEFIHSLVDIGNQSLLYKGIVSSSREPDKFYQYGYGKAYFFYALISALSMFASGASVALFNGVHGLVYPPTNHIEYTTSVWAVLGISFVVDGYVLCKTAADVYASKPKEVPFFIHLKKIKDPILMAILLEDLGACTGILIAGTGIYLSQRFETHLFDSLATVGVGSLLALIALRLVKLNQQFLLGAAIEPNESQAIVELLRTKKGIENVSSVRTQWLGPNSFSFKADVDFDGTYLFIKLREKYVDLFLNTNDRKQCEVYMSFFCEDVVRLVEKEVNECAKLIREKFPECKIIEIEPDSKHHNTIALPKQEEFLMLFNKERDEIKKYQAKPK